MRLCLTGFWLILLLGSQSFAQERREDFSRHLPTENVHPKNRDANKPGNRPKRANYSVIYKNSSEGTLYGNPCAKEATQHMGFEYVLEAKGLPGSTPWPLRILNNVWVNTKLIFTRSPFWKAILKKQINECRGKSGDMVG